MEAVNEQLRRELEDITGKSLLPESSSQLFREQLGNYLNYLIVHDQHKLIFILYRVDLSEHRIKLLLHEHPDNAGLLMADLIIERQLQKIISRRQFRQERNDIPDEDRW